MTTLVIAEHDNQTLKQDTAKVITAASQLGADVHLLVAGFDCQQVIEDARKLEGIAQVLVTDASEYQHHFADNMAKLVESLAGDYQNILAAASSQGKDMMPRLAALLDVAQISEIVAIEAPDTFVRPIYAGNALASIQSLDDKKIITVRTSAFDATTSSDSLASVIEMNAIFPSMNRFVSQELTQSERPDLGSASVVISGGRGMGSAENFALLEQLADKLGGAIGASRAAVDAGFVSNDLQVGQTGKIVAPDLYIAVGISGAIQHLAGMKEAKVIVAINKDADAPIFKVADYGLQADLFAAIPELIDLL